MQKSVDVADARNLNRPVTLQREYNLLAREIEWEVVPACLAEGLGLLRWSPLGGGWLTGKYRRDQPPSGANRLGEDRGRGVESYEAKHPVLDPVALPGLGRVMATCNVQPGPCLGLAMRASRARKG